MSSSLYDPIINQLIQHSTEIEGMSFQKESLDLVFVPSGLAIMFGYHLFLLYRCLKIPHTTVIGFENNDKKAWIESIMQGDNKNASMALSVISSSVSAATFFSSVCLTLSSVMGAVLTTNSSILESDFIYGDTRPATLSVKYTCLLVCFLLAFSCFIQSSRCFIHATFLITMPNSNITAKHVETTVIRAGDFWSFGLRSLYFALTLLLWFFGPIPMFVSSVVMVVLLHYLDTNTTPLHQHAKRPAKHPMLG
nr:PREDICTED: uncharacterized protein LOC108223954 [Daucus carota subsp. sativus]